MIKVYKKKILKSKLYKKEIVKSKVYKKEIIKNIIKKNFSNNENKNYMNFIFSTNILDNIKNKKNFNWNNSIVIVLDSIERNTSNTLLSLGIPKDSLLLVEENTEVTNNHIKNGFPTHQGTLKDFSDNKNDKTYSFSHQNYRNYDVQGIYFDTCGSINKQEEGILNTLNKTNLQDNCILGFTFCKRGITNIEYIKLKNKFIKKLEKVLVKIGFNINKLYDYDYNGYQIFNKSIGAPMNSFFIKIKK